MNTTFLPNKYNMLISYLKRNPALTEEIYDDLALSMSMQQVDNESNTIITTITSPEEVKKYFDSHRAA